MWRIGKRCTKEKSREWKKGERIRERPCGISNGPGLLIAVMLRADVVRFARGGRLVGKPLPVGMYDRVNGIVAEHLATELFFIPNFATVLQHFPELPRTRCKRKNTRLTSWKLLQLSCSIGGSFSCLLGKQQRYNRSLCMRKCRSAHFYAHHRSQRFARMYE